MRRILTVVLFLDLAVSALPAQVAGTRPYAPGTPQFGTGADLHSYGLTVLRQDEDWRYLRDEERVGLSQLKFIPLDEEGNISLSLAMNTRFALEVFRDEGWGAYPDWDAYLNTRVNLHTSLQFYDRGRLYLAFKHGGTWWRDGVSPPIDEDHIDLHQAFAELSFGDLFGAEEESVLLRAGRQELHYGEGRMISIREEPNLRNDFDAALVRAHIGPSVSDIFAAWFVEDGSGSFDNATNFDAGMWGIYSWYPLGSSHFMDAYYIGHAGEVGGYTIPVTGEVRHSVGTRIASRYANAGLVWGMEGVYQVGSADPSLFISAWSASGRIEYGWNETKVRPALGFRFAVSSGDMDSGDGILGTFRAPAPSGLDYGRSEIIGPGNLATMQAYAIFHPGQRWSIKAYYRPFWRLSAEDSLYNGGNGVLRDSTGNEHFIGSELGSDIVFTWNRHWNVEMYLAWFLAGPYMQENPPSEDIVMITLLTHFQF